MRLAKLLSHWANNETSVGRGGAFHRSGPHAAAGIAAALKRLAHHTVYSCRESVQELERSICFHASSTPVVTEAEVRDKSNRTACATSLF